MEIKIINKITAGAHTEVMEEVFPCQLNEKSGKFFLTYFNAEKIKHLLKFDAQKLMRIQYAENNVNFQFEAGKKTLTHIPSLGYLEVETLNYDSDFNLNEGQLILDYHLSKDEQELADYHLEIYYA